MNIRSTGGILNEFYLVPWNHSGFRKLEFAKTITEVLQTLRRLNLSIVVDSFEGLGPLEGICDWFEAISGMNKLECIEIHLDVLFYKPHDDDWRRLEEILLKSGWPELKRVSLTLTFDDQSTTEYELAKKFDADTLFPRLSRSKQLDFQFSAGFSIPSDEYD